MMMAPGLDRAPSSASEISFFGTTRGCPQVSLFRPIASAPRRPSSQAWRTTTLLRRAEFICLAAVLASIVSRGSLVVDRTHRARPAQAGCESGWTPAGVGPLRTSIAAMAELPSSKRAGGQRKLV
jgi:hypothetical protein